MAPRQKHIELYRRRDGLTAWRVVAGNGKITDIPGQGFTRPWSAKRSALRAHPDLPVLDLTKPAPELS